MAEAIRMKPRVLQLLPTLKRAGAERVAVSLALGLPAHGWHTEVVSLYDAFPGGFQNTLHEAAVPVHHLGKHRGLDLRMVSQLRRVFALQQPAIIHTHSYLLRYVLPAWSSWPAARIVHTVHNLAQREVDLPGRLIHRWAFWRGVTPVAVGDEVAQSFLHVYGRPVAATIPNGVEVFPHVEPAAVAAVRSQLGLSPETPLAICVARLEPQKNHAGLLEAFHQAFAPDSPWRLLLVGDGSLRAALEAHVLRLGLQDRVHFLGLQADVAPALAAADLFVLASHWEGAPLAVMEALAAGLPIVATRVGGLPNLVTDGEDGLLAAPHHPVELVGALRALALDPTRRKAMGEAARRNARRFGIDAMVNAYAHLFHQLLGGAG
ncbi:MAG: glycosyltransferase [Bryobacterales bacterium]|nr:glycosyltransferase [Bryobacterales bacterium]